MKDEIRAITLPADLRRRPILRTLKRSDPDHYRRYVGGPIEAVRFGNPEATLYLNEDGIALNLTPNVRAEALVELYRPGFLLHDHILGDVVIVGGSDWHAEDTDVQERYIRELGAKPLEVPQPPNDRMGDGYDFMEKLEGSGWFAVGLWGSEGFNLGRWPLQAICHYDGESFGFCSYTEGDLNVQAFETEAERDHATDEYFVWFNKFHEIEGAPQEMDDPRLGRYRG